MKNKMMWEEMHHGWEKFVIESNQAVLNLGLEHGHLESSPNDGDADWTVDLAKKLTELQQPDGSVRVVDDRWMEDNPVLITAYALIAAQNAR